MTISPAQPFLVPRDEPSPASRGAASHEPLPAATWADPTQHLAARAKAMNIAFVEDLKGWQSDATFVEKVPISFARDYLVLGLKPHVIDAEGLMDDASTALPVAIGSLDDGSALDIVSRFLGVPVEPVLSTPAAILDAINLAYQQRNGQAEAMIQSLNRQEVLAEVSSLSDQSREDLLDVASRAPVIKLVNLLLFEAVKLEASDVHLHPYEDRLVARIRIDGVLHDCFDVPKHLQEAVSSRVKVMGRMNIAEKRLPQDGRATVQVGDRLIDLRIASLPSSLGERIVIRLLDKSVRHYSLTNLGMDADVMSRFSQVIGAEHGIVLVTGPTGSGKTTTLYAVLQQINNKQRNVLTLEDPIEFQLDGISQTQINDKKGMTFASGLRSVLRQDPDVIMVGEIRDHETAVMAIQSALTGHLVFSTLHTNDAASAITRLLDLGIEPYLVSSSVIGVLAQRLVRRLCPHCAAPSDWTEDELASLQLDAAALTTGRVRTAVGCDACRNTGYRGRVGIFELLTMQDDIRHLIQSRASASQIKRQAIEAGMTTLRSEGLSKVSQGITTIEEVERTTMR